MDVVGATNKNVADFDHVENKRIDSPEFERILPRQMITGTMRGTQGVGGDGVAIDSAARRIGVAKIAGTENDYAVELTEDGIEVNDGSLGFIRITKDGFSISDGTITFISITKDGIILNDGTNDRILIGKDEGGF